MKNIVLIGMPGSGKTAIGNSIARKTGRVCIDIDDEIEKLEGMTVPEIFKEYGEAYFREKESEMVQFICKDSGIVITTGGGSVLDHDNIRSMKQNGILVWIKRDLSKLDMGGRPLSKDMNALKQIYTERKEIYNKNCDIEIENNGSIDDAANSAIDKIIRYTNKKGYTDKNGGFR